MGRGGEVEVRGDVFIILNMLNRGRTTIEV